MGAAALMSLRDNATTLRGFGGFLLAVLAAPGLLVVGAPLQSGSTRYLAACAGSALLWFAVGVVASRRSTRRPAASWREFWVEYAWLVGAVWCGVVAALVLSNLVLGRALL